MKPSASITLRPCVIIALELFGLDEDEAHEGRLQRTLVMMEQDFGDREIFERRFFVVGHRVFRLTPIKSGGAAANAFRELLDVVHLQEYLIGRRILARGAVTFGNVAWRTDLVMGAGLAEAERLCTLAEFPRVMVDPRLLQEVENNENLRDHPLLTELGYIRKLLRQDADGQWFVDYLRTMATEVDEPELYLDLLEGHRHFVEQRLKACVTLDPTSRALTWLWSYHNQVVEECFRRKAISSTQKEHLRLSAQSPFVYVFPPSAKAPD
jgi:hypothetical protein